MKFVGATDWFIRWPFVIEGIVIGAIGSLLSSILLYFAYYRCFLLINISIIKLYRKQRTIIYMTLFR